MRNMRSIGVDLEPLVEQRAAADSTRRAPRSTAWRCTWRTMPQGGHRVRARPSVVVDPISNFVAARHDADAQAMLMRLIDFLKTQQITAMFTSLTLGRRRAVEQTEVGVSSLMDTWLLLRDIEVGRRAQPRRSTSSSRAAWRTRTRCANSCSRRGRRAGGRLHRARGRADRARRARRRRRARGPRRSRGSRSVERKQRDLERRRRGARTRRSPRCEAELRAAEAEAGR